MAAISAGSSSLQESDNHSEKARSEAAKAIDKMIDERLRQQEQSQVFFGRPKHNSKQEGFVVRPSGFQPKMQNIKLWHLSSDSASV